MKALPVVFSILRDPVLQVRSVKLTRRSHHNTGMVIFATVGVPPGLQFVAARGCHGLVAMQSRCIQATCENLAAGCMEDEADGWQVS